MMETKLKVLDLFSGIGGFSLGFERAGMRTVAFCEIEKYPQTILRKHWPDIPIFEDIRTLHAKDISESIDIICGGYPCQPFSIAGKRRGTKDNRYLWPEVIRLIREMDTLAEKPSWCVFENVAGHVNMGLDKTLFDLENEGYTTQALIIPACAINAPHKRDRVWIIAHSNSPRFQTQGANCEWELQSKRFEQNIRRRFRNCYKKQNRQLQTISPPQQQEITKILEI